MALHSDYAVCPICGSCGREFKKSPSDVTTKTCGRTECTKAYKVKNTPAQAIESAHKALKTNPNTGHFATHHGAVEWRIVSPSGDLYEFKNLVLWAEQHEDLLPVSPRAGRRVSARTFCREIQRLKSDAEKYSCLRTDYHGWRVLKMMDDIEKRL